MTGNRMVRSFVGMLTGAWTMELSRFGHKRFDAVANHGMLGEKSASALAS
jgi:hypothetical protein